MGRIKYKISQIEDYKKTTYKILLDIGAIKTCEYHESFYYDTGKFSFGNISEDGELYDLSDYELNKYDGFDDISLFHDIIDDIMSEAADSADECPECQKMNNE